MLEGLVVLGAVCIVAAIVGGGLKVKGIELPLVESPSRQILLAVAGVGLIVFTSHRLGWWGDRPPPEPPAPTASEPVERLLGQLGTDKNLFRDDDAIIADNAKAGAEALERLLSSGRGSRYCSIEPPGRISGVYRGNIDGCQRAAQAPEYCAPCPSSFYCYQSTDPTGGTSRYCYSTPALCAKEQQQANAGGPACFATKNLD
jgi:hypothetical protein